MRNCQAVLGGGCATGTVRKVGQRSFAATVRAKNSAIDHMAAGDQSG